MQKLPDLLIPDLRVVFCGTAAGDRSAAAGAYYAGPGNQFWRTLHDIGLTPRQLAPAEFSKLIEFGIGLTDIAKHQAGADATLRKRDFDVKAFRQKIERVSPAAIAFNGKKAASVFFCCATGPLRYGRRPETLGTASIWILPSTSGAARGTWDVQPWEDLAAAILS